jgi:hypothetical protein
MSSVACSRWMGCGRSFLSRVTCAAVWASPTTGLGETWLVSRSLFVSIIVIPQNATVIPVPSAYNDLGTDSSLRDHVGWVWYQRRFHLADYDRRYRIFVRFSSVNYYALVVSCRLRD